VTDPEEKGLLGILEKKIILKCTFKNRMGRRGMCSTGSG
jgi:hypothetical protein